MKNVLVIMPWMNDTYRQMLEEAAPGCALTYRMPKEAREEDVARADIILGNVPPSLLREKKLELMQLTSAGADAYVAPGLLDRSTPLCCCTGAYSQSVAEHALAMTLMLQKDLHKYRDAQARHEWIDGGRTYSMSDAVVVVVGLGDIGRYYARQAKALGAYVIGVKRRASDKPDFVDELVTTDAVDGVLGRGDVIAAFLPGTDKTYHFFSDERFALMKPSAVFINCGRGTAVSAEALELALREGKIRSAGVDVFETEPLSADSSLWELEDLSITPHASGFFHLPVTLERVMDICVTNLRACLSGGELRNIVDYGTGYKK